jgi:hypothetical protein
MACCKGTATYFHCYPDPCGSPGGCCCQGNNCSAGCSSSSLCGVGACCTCNSGNWGYAYNPTKFCFTPSCGDYSYFTNAANCSTYYMARRVDTLPSGSAIVDLTPALFTQFAPLSDGIIPNMRVLNNTNECC